VPDLGDAAAMPVSLIHASCGPYILRELISAGATAEVYRATHRDDGGRSYAAKVLRSERVGEAAALAAEHDLLQRLDHPAVPKALRLGDTAGRPTLVMQYLAGPTLGQATAAGPLAGGADLVRTFASAVAALHQAGTIHNDLKPDNIILTGAGRIALVDFGNARSSSASSVFARLFRRTPATIIATPTYVAPEVLAGGPPSPASDVYALGVVAHVLCAGSAPWPAGPHRPPVAPSLRQRLPTATPALIRAVDACLRPRADRPADAGEFIALLG
jgi:eukaryotic-like serine/threonine-protein kinase